MQWVVRVARAGRDDIELHLCGVVHIRLGERDMARTRLTAALAKREPLTHPGVGDTRAELARLGGEPQSDSQSSLLTPACRRIRLNRPLLMSP